MPINLSGLEFFMPVFGFVFVFVIIYALLAKTKILGGVIWIDVIVSGIIAIIFSTIISVREYIQAVTPWFVVLVVALFFILIIIGLSQQNIDKIMKPGFVWVFIIALILVFFIAAIRVFDPVFYNIKWFVFSRGRIFGGIILLAIAVLVGWIITRK